LNRAGVATKPKADPNNSGGFHRQDLETDPFRKIANGAALRQALLHAGRLEYALGRPLDGRRAPDPVAKGHNGVPIGLASVLPRLIEARSRYVYWRILDRPELITMSSADSDYLCLPEIMLAFPELATEQPGLHYLSPTWSFERVDLTYLASTLARFHASFPLHRAFIQSASLVEFGLLQAAGIPSILCNGSIYEDETKFTIAQQGFEGIPQSDALYLANFIPYKRHALCARLDQPLLIYGRNARESIDKSMAQMRLINRGAVFVNHVLHNGEYQRLEPDAISRVARHARTGLCLSEVEGYMRASIQLLLCGLPLVSTPSLGGRDRYYTDDNALIVAPDADAIRDGVAALKERRLSPEIVRASALAQVTKDRDRFVGEANRMAAKLFGPTTRPVDFTMFRGAKFRPAAMADLVHALRNRAGLEPIE
jgi:hypothetical protein